MEAEEEDGVVEVVEEAKEVGAVGVVIKVGAEGYDGL